MPLAGEDKKEVNFVAYRTREQMGFWPDFCEQWDEEQKGKRFRSESLPLVKLFNLYVHGVENTELTEEQKERGEKEPKKLTKREKEAIGEVAPISCRRIIYRETMSVDEGGEPVGTGEYIHNVRFHDNGYLHFDQWLYARDQARKELFWLCKEVVKLDVEPEVHQIICDQFVSKDFDGVFRKDYALPAFQKAMKRQSRVPRQWVKTADYAPKTLGDFGRYVEDPIQKQVQANYAQTMILLDPRGFFKSTIDSIDVVQWIINCPDIRILLMSGGLKLVTQFLVDIKRRFYLPKGQAPSALHLLFPEHVIRGVDGESEQPLISRARIHHSPDPTLGIISVGSNMAGFHCELAKLDDVVTETNCNTDDTREAIKEKADGAVNLVMPWGWIDLIGTRYFPDDYYGKTLDKHRENPEAFPLKFHTRACWVVKPEFISVERKGLMFLQEHMVNLTFPQVGDWKTLRSKLGQNEKKFRCQQLNQPVWGDAEVPNFPMSLLMSRRKSLIEAIDIRNRKAPYIVGAIDTAREAKKSSDYTVIVVGYVYPNDKGVVCLLIVDVDYGKWTQTDIANHIAAMNAKYQPTQWVGEDSGVGDLLKQKILDISRTVYGMWANIAWLTPSNNPQAKVSRIKGIEILLRSERMDFVEGTWNGDAFDQFEGYKGQKSTRTKKDDIPDAISYLARFLPSSTPLTPEEQDEKVKIDQDAYYKRLLKAHHERLFGTNEGNRQMPMQMSEPETPSSPTSDIAKRLFGGNGLRG